MIHIDFYGCGRGSIFQQSKQYSLEKQILANNVASVAQLRLVYDSLDRFAVATLTFERSL